MKQKITPKPPLHLSKHLNLEDELAARHIAYAKVQEKLGNRKLMLEELERAVELEPNRESYSLADCRLTQSMQAEA